VYCFFVYIYMCVCVVVCMKDHQANKLSFFYSEIYIDPALKKERLVGLFEASALSTISNFRVFQFSIKLRRS